VIEVAYDAARCDALVDPLDGCGNWLFPHHSDVIIRAKVRVSCESSSAGS
jgi:hypothetical protein